MKKLLAYAAFVTIVAATAPASALDPGGSLVLSTTAAQQCSTDVALEKAVGVTLDKILSGPNNHATETSLLAFAVATITCTAPGAKLGLKTTNGALTLEGVLKSQYTPPNKYINYTATAKYSTLVAELTTTTAGQFANSADVTGDAVDQGRLTIDLSIPADEVTRMAGSYTDTLSVTVGQGY